MFYYGLKKKRILAGDQVVYVQDTQNIIYKYQDLGGKKMLGSRKLVEELC